MQSPASRVEKGKQDHRIDMAAVLIQQTYMNLPVEVMALIPRIRYDGFYSKQEMTEAKYSAFMNPCSQDVLPALGFDRR